MDYQQATDFVLAENRYAWRESWPVNRYICMSTAGPVLMLNGNSEYQASEEDRGATDWQTGDEPRHW